MPTRYHVAVRREGDGSILVLADGSMPGFTLTDAPDWQVVVPVVDGLEAEHGLQVVALRAAWLGEPRVDGGMDRLYEAVHVGGEPPAGARWVALADLERRTTPLGRAIEGGVLRPSTGDRQPWYRPGWFAEVTDWIDDRIRDAGLRRRGPIRQVRSWGRAAVLMVETDRGRLWAKEVPSVFAHEVAVTGLLSDVDPGIVPPLVAADAARGRLLMEHVDGPMLASQPGALEAWTATTARLAEIQRVMADDVTALSRAGVPRASVTALADRVRGLLDDDDLSLAGRPAGLTDPERARLVRAIPDLVAACHALASSPFGPSVEHGDLTPGQVILGAMGPVFLDWSDATIAHPFLAAASFLSDPERLPAGLVDRVESAYLDGWTGSLGRDDAAAALQLAKIVHPLHMAQLHADWILPGLEQPWELERVVPGLLRSLLPRVDALPRMLLA